MRNTSRNEILAAEENFGILEVNSRAPAGQCDRTLATSVTCNFCKLWELANKYTVIILGRLKHTNKIKKIEITYCRQIKNYDYLTCLFPDYFLYM